MMRFGYWMPIFGGWLRNVRDEGMPVAWPYVRDLAAESEQHGFGLSLIAELNLNDIKGPREPSLDCWTLAPAVAAVTSTLELMLAVRPNYHSPSLTAKALSTLDVIAPGRVSLNVVSSWWKDEAAQYGAPFDVHDARYARTQEWLDVVGAHAARGHRFPRRAALPPRQRRARAQAQPAAAGLHGRRVAQGQGGHRGPGRRLRHARGRPRGHRGQGGRPERAARGGRAAADDVRGVGLRDLPGHRGRGAGRAGPHPQRPVFTRGLRVLPGLRRRARSWSRRSRWRSTASPTGACAVAWSARPTRSSTGSGPTSRRASA